MARARNVRVDHREVAAAHVGDVEAGLVRRERQGEGRLAGRDDGHAGHRPRVDHADLTALAVGDVEPPAPVEDEMGRFVPHRRGALDGAGRRGDPQHAVARPVADEQVRAVGARREAEGLAGDGQAAGRLPGSTTVTARPSGWVR